MQKTLSLLALVCLLCGCAGQRKFVSSGFHKIVVSVWIDSKGQIVFGNNTGTDLHNVKLNVGSHVYYDSFFYIDDLKFSSWETGSDYRATLRWPGMDIRVISVSGWCDEGRIKGYWTASQ